jgi:hypothetical protein
MIGFFKTSLSGRAVRYRFFPASQDYGSSAGLCGLLFLAWWPLDGAANVRLGADVA